MVPQVRSWAVVFKRTLLAPLRRTIDYCPANNDGTVAAAESFLRSKRMPTAKVHRFAVVAMTALCCLLSGSIQAQTKVRFAEVARSLLFAPAYVAVSKGYFKDAGLDVSITTIPGGDKTMAALLSNSADIALIGPEAAIYVWN